MFWKPLGFGCLGNAPRLVGVNHQIESEKTAALLIGRWLAFLNGSVELLKEEGEFPNVYHQNASFSHTHKMYISYILLLFPVNLCILYIHICPYDIHICPYAIHMVPYDCSCFQHSPQEAAAATNLEVESLELSMGMSTLEKPEMLGPGINHGNLRETNAGWWLQTFFIFNPTWGRFPF